MYQIPISSYGDFGKYLHETTASKRIPIKGIFEVTPLCNLDCIHCYVKVDGRKRDLLNYQEICHIIDMVAAEGCLWLTFSGGEPFIRDDFLDIYMYAKKKGLLIRINSNGTLITPKIADYLRKNPPHSITLSFYGITQETYEAITNTPGSFESFMYGIRRLLDYNLPIKLSAVMMTINRHEVLKMKKFGKELNVETNFYLSLSPRIDGSMDPCKIRLSPEEVLKIDLADTDRYEKWLKVVGKIRSGLDPSNNPVNCTAGLNHFQIDCHGMLNLCSLFRIPEYNLCRGNFKDGWNLLSEVRLKRMKYAPKCQGCAWGSICPQCSARSELEEGSWEKPINYFCKIAQLRTDAFGRIIDGGDKNGE